MPASALAPSEAPTPAAAPGESPTPAPHPAPRAAVVRPTLLGAAVGGAQGALLYGGAIALLHARHNALGTWDALVLLGWCLLLYGAGAAVATGAAMAALRLVRRVRSAATAVMEATAVTSARDVASTAAAATTTRDATAAGLRRDLWLASAAFHFAFWLFASSYGLTYDEAPHWVQTAWPMLGYLVLRGLVVLAAVAAMAWLLLAIGYAAARRGRLGTLLAVLALLLVGGQIALAHRAVPREKPPLPATFGARGGHRVAVVGVDGADWRVILPMVQRGELPNLARLMAEGSWGPLATFPDSNSAVIWASIYTGRRPATHSILDFYAIRLAGMSEATFGVYPVHRTFFKELALRLQRLGLARVQPIDRSQVEAPLIWEVASAARRSVGVVDGYYYSYPAPVLGDPRSFFLGYGSDGLWQQAAREKRALRHDEAALQAWPAGLLAAEGRFLTLPDFTWQGTVALDLLARYAQPDLLTLYSHEPDAVQHETWRFHEPSRFFGVDPATAAAHDDVARFYRELDASLGRLRARLAPDTVLVVVSDHGHSPTIFHSMDTQHRHGPPGILLLHGGPVRAGRLPARAGVLDVYPTLLYLLGIPVPADADGEVLAAALDPAFVARHPPTRVSSWDGLPRPRSAAPPDPERRRQELEKLYSLGYIR
jgi:hypothetical protein